MYLKEIKVSGFKSFADTIDIELTNGISGIVGPNGSGKSNVVDAVRWVLGEQSVKQLRGEGAMSDVIFIGSKSRRAASFASVTLVFDNSDKYLNIEYDEVQIKRTIYKTGENEKTILKYDNSKSNSRDGIAIRLSNKNTIIANLVYYFKPTKVDNYSNAIFEKTYGTTKNVFFVIDNTSKLASYDYFNDHTLTHNVENSTFYHTKGSVSKNWSGSGIYTNIATNANPTGTLENVINENFTSEITNIQKIISDSKNNESFNNSGVGVFYGKNAWK